MKRIAAFLLVLTLSCFSIPSQVYAADTPKAKEVIFVLDASNSMIANDPERLAEDSVKQMAYSLPSNYSVGFVAYNNDVVASIPPAQSKKWSQIASLVDSVSYVGFTHAGAGLTEALTLFSPAAEKVIVLISDGEIIMQDAAQTAASVESFTQAATEAKNQNIPIYTIALGDELNEPENNIFSASELTNGKIYCAPTANELQATVRQILFGDLGVKKSAVGVAQANAGTNSLTIHIPATGASKARILITADNAIQNVVANYNAVGGEVITGNRFAVVEIEKPQQQQVTISFQCARVGSARAELITEYSGHLTAQVSYEDYLVEAENRMTRQATIALQLIDPQTEMILLSAPYFTGQNVTIAFDGVSERHRLQDGIVTLTRDVLDTKTIDTVLTAPELDINLIAAAATTTITLEAPEQPLPPKLSRMEIIAICIGVIALLGVAITAAVIHKKKTAYHTSIDYSFGFSGKLDVYIVWARGGEYEIPPFTFPLGQLVREKRISLAQVLSAGNVNLSFSGAEKIWFMVGPERSILLKNQSAASILFAGSDVKQSGQIQLSYGQKIYISFEQDVDEIEIYYRNVKDSTHNGTERSHHYLTHS